LIDPLQDVAYIMAEEVEIVDCATTDFEMFLNGGPLSLSSLHQYAIKKAESDRLEVTYG
jgi:hypothetical protein